MKISSKISLSIFFFLTIFGINTFVALSQLSKIGRELNDIVNDDIVMAGVCASIKENQLEKAILLERVLRIAEEIGFEDVPAARKAYLLDHTQIIQAGLDYFSQSIHAAIVRGQKVIAQGKARRPSQPQRNEFLAVESFLQKIEQDHEQYDQLVKKILEMITQGGYQLSFEDIDRIETREKSLAAEVKVLVEKIQGFIHRSLENAHREERLARNLLLFSFAISLLLSFIIAFLIIRSIAHPLKLLVNAAHQVGVGNFAVHLDETSRDEIGEVSTAFNIMAGKLSEFKAELERKNAILSQNLEVTNRQKKDLEKVNRELDNFIHTVSHDIRAPLVGIAGYGAFLQKHYADQFDKKAGDCVSGIRRAANRLNSLIEDLLALTHISRIKNPYENASLYTMLDDVRERLEFDIRKHSVELSIQPNVPVVGCDRIKLTEALFNLINNAIKFSSKNGDKVPRIEVGYRDQGGFHEIHVKDNGIGIAPENHARVFGVFQRLHDSRQYEGTGIGLTIVKRVIDDHGGNVWIESQPGAGAAFHFTIPKNLSVTPKNNPA